MSVVEASLARGGGSRKRRAMIVFDEEEEECDIVERRTSLELYREVCAAGCNGLYSPFFLGIYRIWVTGLHTTYIPICTRLTRHN